MKISELSLKDIVNDHDGSKIGKITDLEIDVATGKILNVYIQGVSKVYQIFSRNSVLIPWNKIIKIGSDVVIVDDGYKSKSLDKN